MPGKSAYMIIMAPKYQKTPSCPFWMKLPKVALTNDSP